jgi:hypothetical protein
VKTNAENQPIRVFICDPEHPHYGESGVFTGEIITMRFSGQQMALVKLDACAHGTSACYVSKGQVREERRRP